MRKKLLWISIAIILVLSVSVLTACSGGTPGSNYTIPQIDLSAAPAGAENEEIYQNYTVDDGSDYMAHPDSVIVDRNGLEAIMAFYPEGHGKGAILTKISTDGGKTWSERLDGTPESWKKSMETPTVYRLNFNDGSTKLLLTSANPSWNKLTKFYDGVPAGKGNGFNASLSSDEGRSWTEFEKFYGYGKEGYVDPIVAMASLTRLKDGNGNWLDAWMGFFHDYDFVNYKTILTFENGAMKWSMPEKYFSDYRKIEKSSNMCEVEVIRSEKGEGNRLCLISRSNSKKINSLISYSDDEGKTWSEPKEAPSAVSGERHKAEWLPDGRLFITFRSIERDPVKLKKHREKNGMNWFSEGWVAWVGTYEDLINGTEGQYRVKLAHTYLNKQSAPNVTANGDTGYCGNVVLKDGTIVTMSYGTFGKKKSNGEFKTYIVAKRIDISAIDRIVQA